MAEHEANHHIIVDESGDAVLFNVQDEVIIGQGDTPLVFMVGAVHLPCLAAVREKLAAIKTH